MKSLVFCTSHTDSGLMRYEAWAKHYLESFRGHDVDLLMVDDGSAPCEIDGVKRLTLNPHLGRQSLTVMPGWKRSFWRALMYADDRGYRRVAHVESDLFIKPGSIPEFMGHLAEDDFQAGWCRSYGFPETALMILNGPIMRQMLDHYYDSEQWYESQFFERVIEKIGPRRIMSGDRFEGHPERLRDSDSYIAQYDWGNP